jgi:hypothetical protein
VSDALVLNGRMLATGERCAALVADGALGARTFDDAYTAPADGAPFVGGPQLPIVAPEEHYRAAFSITVTDGP